ncbi:MAG: hypothetical protein ABFC63_07995 [Thermoguttaceae bacterium]
MRWFARLAFASALLVLGFVSTAPAGLSEGPRIATFRCDITPPVGQPLFSSDTVRTIEQPLLAKGIVLESQSQRYVLCALDWCELCNGSYDSMRAKIAEAAGTVPAHVALQCVHLHTAPIIDLDAYSLLVEQGVRPDGMHVAPPVFLSIQQRLADAVRVSVGRLIAFDQIGTGQAKVDRVASTRRCRDASGKIQPRFSSTRDPVLRAMPEGLIDPHLKTITFAQGQRPIVRLHYYATHPQTRYGDGRASSDMVGDARERLEREEGVFQIYFTGCSGDITAGKYNDASDKCRAELAGRLFDGMKAAAAATKLVPVETIRWHTEPLMFPRRNDAGFSSDECLARLNNRRESPVARFYGGAVRLAFHQRSAKPIELSSLEIGPVHIVHLPGEPMVAYQLFAQSLCPKDFVAVAGCGDGSPGYLCTQKAFAEGGYEPTASNVKPESEALLKKAIADLLGVTTTQNTQ